VRKRPDGLFPALGGHLRIGHDDGFCAAVWQSGCCILHGHRAGKTSAFLKRDIGCHAASADRRPRRDVVDHEDCAQVELRLIDTDNFGRSDIVGELK
jgi:hypothetical protein